MLNFFKRFGSSEDNESLAQNPAVDQTQLNTSGTTDNRDYYWENKKLTEFLIQNYPKLSQKRNLYYQNKDLNEGEHIDVSNFFSDRDKYIATENDQSNLFFQEFRYLSKEDLKSEEVMTRVETLEKYNKRINETVQKSATKNYDKFQKGISNLDFFQKTVTKCMGDIKDSRQIMSNFQNDLAESSIKIINLFKEKVNKQKAYEFLLKFREDFGGIYKVINALDNDDFTHAHEIIPIIKRAKSEFDKNTALAEQFECLKNSHEYLDAKLEQLNQNIRKGLENIFTDWNEKKFESLLKCHYMLEANYTTTPFLYNELENIVKANVSVARKNAIKYFNKNSFQVKSADTTVPLDFAKSLTKENYLKFINRMFHEMSMLMYNHHLSSRYLEDKIMKGIEIVLEDRTTINLKEYYSKLMSTTLKMRKFVWQTIQKKVAKLLTINHFLDLSYTELVEFLEFSNTFTQIGEDFSNSGSNVFKEILIVRLKDYFNTFHLSHLNNIKEMMETEEWKRMPLPKNYKDQGLINLLSQFPSHERLQSIINPNSSNIFENMSLDEIRKAVSPLTSFVSGNPFKLDDNQKITRISSKIIAAKSPDMTIDDIQENDKTFIDDKADDKISNEKTEDEDVVVCTTANFIVKNFEKYLLLMDLLRPLSLTIFNSMLYSFEYFIYVVLMTFVPSPFRVALFSDLNLNNLSTFTNEEYRMNAIENINEVFSFQQSYKHLKNFVARVIDFFDNSNNKFTSSVKFGGTILLDLGERTIATEAVTFVYNHIKYMQSRVAKIINDPSEAEVVQNFYDSYEKCLPELKSLIYLCFMPMLITPDNQGSQNNKNENCFQSILSLKWDIKEAPSIINIYTDRVIYFIKDFKEKLQCLSGGAIPTKVQNDLNRDFVHFTFGQLTENFSKVKKVSAAGRKMMQSDLQVIVKGLESFCDPKWLEKKETTEKYIMAWFMNSDEVIEFFFQNKAIYSLRQLNSLLATNTAIGNLKKAQRKELTARIEKEIVEYMRESM